MLKYIKDWEARCVGETGEQVKQYDSYLCNAGGLTLSDVISYRRHERSLCNLNMRIRHRSRFIRLLCLRLGIDGRSGLLPSRRIVSHLKMCMETFCNTRRWPTKVLAGTRIGDVVEMNASILSHRRQKRKHLRSSGTQRAVHASSKNCTQRLVHTIQHTNTLRRRWQVPSAKAWTTRRLIDLNLASAY